MNNKTSLQSVQCPRCNGKGMLPTYLNIENGICFLCDGSGTISVKESDKYIVNEIKKDKARIKRNEKREKYLKAEKERIEKNRESWKEKLKAKLVKKPEPEVIVESAYKGSTQEALDIFFDELDDFK